MASTDHEQDIAFAQLPSSDKLPVVVVYIDFTASLTHDKHFRRSHQMAFQGAMDVARDHTTGGINYKTDLLVEVRWREKGSPIGHQLATDDVGQRRIVKMYLFDEIHTLLSLDVPYVSLSATGVKRVGCAM